MHLQRHTWRLEWSYLPVAGMRGVFCCMYVLCVVVCVCVFYGRLLALPRHALRPGTEGMCIRLGLVSGCSRKAAMAQHVYVLKRHCWVLD